MIKTVIKSEIRNIKRDKMYIFFVLFPFVLGGIGYWLNDYLRSNDPNSIVPQIVIMILILITGYIYGSVTAFTLLDDLDDNILMNLKITPISVKQYIYVKLTISFILGFIATILLILVTDFLPGASIISILAISAIGALQAPVIALIVSSFARNKVEGFVIMKMSGILLMVPILVFFVQSWKEVFLIFVPGFWSARLIQIELLPTIDVNFTFIVYFIIGIIYNILFVLLLMKIYSKRSNI